MNLGTDAPLKALGREFIVGRLRWSILRDHCAWLRDWMGDPFAGLASLIDKAPPEVMNRLIAKAEAERDALRSLDVTSDVFKELNTKPMVAARLFYLLLKSKHPEMTEDDAFDIVASADHGAVQAALDKAMGESRPNPQAPAA